MYYVLNCIIFYTLKNATDVTHLNTQIKGGDQQPPELCLPLMWTCYLLNSGAHAICVWLIQISFLSKQKISFSVNLEFLRLNLFVVNPEMYILF